MFEYTRELYSHSAENYNNMADAYGAVGEKEKSEEYRKLANFKPPK